MSLPRERAPNSGRLKSSVSQRRRASGWYADPLADRLAAAKPRDGSRNAAAAPPQKG